MATVRYLVCALVLSVTPLLSGCGGGAEKNVEEQESESIRNERRAAHEKMVPKDAKHAK